MSGMFHKLLFTLDVRKPKRWRCFPPHTTGKIERVESPMHRGMFYDISLPRFRIHSIADMPLGAILA